MNDLSLRLRVEAYQTKNSEMIQLADQAARLIEQLQVERASYREKADQYKTLYQATIQRFLTYIVQTFRG